MNFQLSGSGTELADRSIVCQALLKLSMSIILWQRLGTIHCIGFNIAIFQDGIIRHTAVIPFGGNVITEDIRMGCRIMQKQAERLKVRFGSALVSESKDHEVVCIPGLKGRDAKEIRLSTLAGIIQARMEEIIELVRVEIRNSGFEKKIIGGIVVTGGGSQLKHLPQLFEYITGLDTRIGYPTEH
jgi:cell division protein FtsA